MSQNMKIRLFYWNDRLVCEKLIRLGYMFSEASKLVSYTIAMEMEDLRRLPMDDTATGLRISALILQKMNIDIYSDDFKIDYKFQYKKFMFFQKHLAQIVFKDLESCALQRRSHDQLLPNLAATAPPPPLPEPEYTEFMFEFDGEHLYTRAHYLLNSQHARTYSVLYESGLNCKDRVLRAAISHLLKIFVQAEFKIQPTRFQLHLLYRCPMQEEEESNLLIARVKVENSELTNQLNFRVYPGCYTYKGLQIVVQCLPEDGVPSPLFITEFPYIFSYLDFKNSVKDRRMCYNVLKSVFNGCFGDGHVVKYIDIRSDLSAALVMFDSGSCIQHLFHGGLDTVELTFQNVTIAIEQTISIQRLMQ